MRKIWKLRRIFIPQVTVLLILLISVLCSPTVGFGNTLSSKLENTGATEFAEISKMTETAEVELEAEEELETQATNPPQEDIEVRVADLAPAVRNALAKMGLNPEHIELWIKQHPKTTLVYLNSLSEEKQSEVANVALFIRKVNGRISRREAWREASALVYYSDKYKVPSELSVGIAKTESHFNPGSVSKKGAMGPMQVMWKVHHGMLSARGIATTKEHMLDPERGVEAGILILSRYIGAYGTVQKALTRYYGKSSSVYSNKVNRNIAMLKRHTDTVSN
ncbi:MAG: transglycosylase SLT domain-containing protein [Synergistaceae bacterium]|nr:transglycosylase SLT domain-containing protein [Synergistaceae bacterium]